VGSINVAGPVGEQPGRARSAKGKQVAALRPGARSPPPALKNFLAPFGGEDEGEGASLSYDHNKKAGNPGDVVKHVALVAALDTILKAWPKDKEVFRYADTFAGYARNQLGEGNEWEQGIGKLVGLEESTENEYVKLWSKLCLPSSKSKLAYWQYPGSSMIAYKLCKEQLKVAHLSLWDTSESVLADLLAAFGGQCHNLHQRPAKPDEDAVQNADLILIDPPGLGEDKGFPSWRSIREFCSPREGQSIIVWLPVNANTAEKPPAEDKQSQEIRKGALEELGFHATKVRWAVGGRTIGCQLIFRLPQDAENALRIAVDNIVSVAGWQSGLSVCA
jgi:23S rRNA A2030 N6-methylase RlmJ